MKLSRVLFGMRNEKRLCVEGRVGEGIDWRAVGGSGATLVWWLPE